MGEKICGECKWHRKEDCPRDTQWHCQNENSDYYLDYTDYTDTCEEFEQRGIDR